jgi:hypothetical protein
MLTDTEVKDEPQTPRVPSIDLDELEPPDGMADEKSGGLAAMFGDVFAKFETDLDAKVRSSAA